MTEKQDRDRHTGTSALWKRRDTHGHEHRRGPGGARGRQTRRDGQPRAVQAGRAQTREGLRAARARPPNPRGPRALTSGRSRRAPGAHGGQPPAPARPRCHGARSGPRAADAEPRSDARADARRAARRRPRRPAAREGRGEPGGGGEPPSGREATEEGDGPEAEVTPRPTRPSCLRRVCAIATS